MKNKSFEDVVAMFNKTYKNMEHQENRKYVINQLTKDLKPTRIPLSKLREHLRLKDNLKRLGYNLEDSIIGVRFGNR